jgi:hypothetical protein
VSQAKAEAISKTQLFRVAWKTYYTPAVPVLRHAWLADDKKGNGMEDLFYEIFV